MESKYGLCAVCGQNLVPIRFIEKEEILEGGVWVKTGRTRLAVSHLVCPDCGHVECVDDTFDGPWSK